MLRFSVQPFRTSVTTLNMRPDMQAWYTRWYAPEQGNGDFWYSANVN